MPSLRRCKECLVPFHGVFAISFRMVGIRPSWKNPNLCTIRYEFAPPGGYPAIVSVTFVDAKLHIAPEQLPLAEVVARLNRFYKVAADAVFKLDGIFEKAVGDQAMAFFGVGFRPEDHAQRAVTAVLWVVKTLEDIMDDNESLQVGGGVGNGEAFIDNCRNQRSRTSR